jgi:hypothetical protein
MTCKRRCIKNSSTQPEYSEGCKYCSICKRFVRTEDTYCFCCEYILSESMEEIPRKVSYAKMKLKRKVDSVSLDSKTMLKKVS